MEKEPLMTLNKQKKKSEPQIARITQMEKEPLMTRIAQIMKLVYFLEYSAK